MKIEDKFAEWWAAREGPEDVTRKSFRATFFYGASSALASMIKGNAPRTVDAVKIHFTVLEIDGYSARKNGQGVWQRPADDPRETTLLKEWLIGDAPKTDDHRDTYYEGARSVLSVLFDKDAYRVDVRKVPLLLKEIHEFIEEPRE